MIVDSETMGFEVILNSPAGVTGGAGIQAAQIMASKGAKVVITRNVGPIAFQALSGAGIKIVTGAYEKIRENLERYDRGQLKEIHAPTV